MKRINKIKEKGTNLWNQSVISGLALFFKVKKMKHYKPALFLTTVALAVGVLFIGPVAHADLESSAKLAESGTQGFVKIIGNAGLGICILLFGVTQIMGVELGRWGKKLMLGAILGSAVILNYQEIKNLIWDNLGV